MAQSAVRRASETADTGLVQARAQGLRRVGPKELPQLPRADCAAAGGAPVGFAARGEPLPVVVRCERRIVRQAQRRQPVRERPLACRGEIARQAGGARRPEAWHLLQARGIQLEPGEQVRQQASVQ